MEQTRKYQWGASDEDRKNQRRILWWSLAFIVLFVVASKAIESERIENGSSAIVATIIVSLLGVRVILAHRQFLRDADELMRKIQLDSLALAHGVGVVAGFSYTLLLSADIVSETTALNLVAIMIVTYVVSMLVSMRRYA